MKKLVFSIIATLCGITAIFGVWIIIIHTLKLESLQANVESIEKRLGILSNELSYQKAFLNETIATAITEKLMVEYDDAKEIEIKSVRNLIPLQDLLSLIIKRLELKIIEVPATNGGYELKPKEKW